MITTKQLANSLFRMTEFPYCRFQVTFQHAVPKFVANLPITVRCQVRKLGVNFATKLQVHFKVGTLIVNKCFVYNRSSNFEMNLRTSLRSSRPTSGNWKRNWQDDNKLGNRALNL
jgi:hypothetical protein